MMAAVLDHLWQSTVLALALGLSTLAFRRGPAAVCHGLWFAASVKFLIPFAALAALGRVLAPRIRLPRPAGPQVVFIERAAQPFSQPALTQPPLAAFPFAHGADLQAPLAQAPAAAPLAHTDAAVAAVHAAPHLDLGLILLAVWALGSAAMLILWARRWARLRKVVRSARPVDWPAPMPVLAAPSLVEPGLVGLWRPVLLIPETLPGALPRSGVDAIVAHEAAHLRRRDNVTAAIHMLVEALFWFHPLVWWIGGRLLAEREGACDEAVLAAGHDRATYARSLVESCRLYLQSPLDCVAGASGSNLKSRVQAIMTARPAIPLTRSGKALLLAAAACAFATPVMAGLLTTAEGQKAVARAVAVASRTAPALIAPVKRFAAETGPEPDQSPAAKPVIQAHDEPDLSVARPDVAADPSPDQAQARPGTEDAVRHWILALQTHQPDLDLSPALEQSPRPQLGLTEQMFRSFGGLKAVRFVRVTPEGDDAYEAEFTHAKIQVLVGPLVEGKLTRLAWGPLWTDAGARRTDPVKPMPPVSGMQAPLYRWGGGPAPEAIAPAIQPAATIAPAAGSSAPSLTLVAAPAGANSQVAAFVQSYGEAFWNQDKWICVRVEGLPSDQAAAVKARVEADARAVGVSVGRAECGLRNEVEIRFATDADRAVEGVLDYYHHPVWPFPLERPTGAERPIRAWYGMVWDFAGAPGDGRRGDLGSDPSAGKKLALAIVVVDPARTRGMSLDTVSDYAAMLALSQPRALDRCNVLPSITDLYAGACSGRAPPTGLTAADTAFLTALYRGSAGLRATRSPSELVDAVAKRLAGDRLAAL